MLHHGGRLRAAAAEYGISASEWLDLSTGINPSGWPVPVPPPTVWRRLPEDEDGLAAKAALHYGAPAALPLPGSQAAIQTLPRLRPAGMVAVLSPAYAEHAQCWRNAGHSVALTAADALDERVDSVDVVVVVNPNNPTGGRIDPERLLAWHRRLRARGGWLVVDEAFMDMTPEQSLAPYTDRPGLIVLRSLGKFYGLAGARVGFALLADPLRSALADALGPWPLAGPSRWVTGVAFDDTAWQRTMREHLRLQGGRLAEMLASHGLPPAGGTALFQWVPTTRARAVHQALAREAILVRLFDDPPGLRFGLPGSDVDWTRLTSALERIMRQA